MGSLICFVSVCVAQSSTDSARENSKNGLGNTKIGQAVFAQYCFWTGERKLGALEGVIKTEAGFYDGHEVTRVWFDRDKLSPSKLVEAAQRMGVADRVYLPDDLKISSQTSLKKSLFIDTNYRKAPRSDQKRQLQGTVFEGLTLSDFQSTKVNAFARSDSSKAMTYLNDSQKEKIKK